jgi:hypothetical protein
MPHKSEAQFLVELEKKSQEERRLVGTEVLPTWAKGLGEWLVVNPWRVLVPIAGITYLGLRMMLGAGYRDFILGLFGGFK